MKLSDLKQAEYNPRIMDNEAKKGLSYSISSN